MNKSSKAAGLAGCETSASPHTAAPEIPKSRLYTGASPPPLSSREERGICCSASCSCPCSGALSHALCGCRRSWSASAAAFAVRFTSGHGFNRATRALRNGASAPEVERRYLRWRQSSGIYWGDEDTDQGGVAVRGELEHDGGRCAFALLRGVRTDRLQLFGNDQRGSGTDFARTHRTRLRADLSTTRWNDIDAELSGGIARRSFASDANGGGSVDGDIEFWTGDARRAEIVG